jgi:hypothetical protein
MHYKTIMLDLLEQYPSLYDRLRTSGTLMQSMEHYASELKERHTSWMNTLAQERPGSNPAQIASQALELALQDLQERLSAASAPNADAPEETLSLEAAMHFLRRHTPPA